MKEGSHTGRSGVPAKATPPGGTLGWVGPYQLVERLPYQGGAIEYLARQRGPFGFERSCRLKLVPSANHAGDQRAAEAVAREAKVVLRLDHPNIVRLYDLFEHGSDLVLVMEHFSSLSLARLLELLAKQRADLPRAAVWHVAHGLFDGLAHAHGVMDARGENAPVVHTDVRPANVLIAADGRVRLSGFGHARLGDREESTACGQIGNGPSYVAPEQLQGRNVTERVDTYAAALIVWELLTGRCATPDGLADFELLRHLSQRQAEPLRILRQDLPPLVTTALDACLTSDPAERTIQAEEVAGCIAAAMDLRAGEEALREAVASLGAAWGGLAAGDPTSSPVPRGARSAPPSSSQRSRKPAFSVSIPAAAPVPDVGDALPAWDEITQVPAAPKSSVVDPPRISPSQAIRQASTAPPARPRLGGSLSPTTASPLADTLPPRNTRRKLLRQSLLAAPVAMVAAVVTFAAIGGWNQRAASKASGGSASPAHVTSGKAHAPREPETPAKPPKPKARLAAAPSATVAPPPAPVVKSAPIPRDRAVLVVHAPPEGWVYVQGAPAGKTGEPIETSCGRRFVRVGTEPDDHGMLGVRWLSEGQGVLLRCGQRREVSGSPDQ